MSELNNYKDKLSTHYLSILNKSYEIKPLYINPKRFLKRISSLLKAKGYDTSKDKLDISLL